MGVANEKPGAPRSGLARQAAIGLAILAVLACTILGSAVLTMREGTLISLLRPAATPTLPPLVLLTPTGTSAQTSTAQTATATGSPVAEAQTRTPTPVPPSVTPTVITAAATATNTESPTATGTPSATATATALATSTASATPRPSATSAPRPTCLVPASWRIYLVRSGDTLTSLAVQHRTTVAAIMDANCLTTSSIYSGQRLYLPVVPVPPPPPPTLAPTPTSCSPQPPAGWVLYTVQSGDSLYGLAQRYQTTVLRIQQVNCLSGYVISAGQQLYLPPLPATPTATWTLVATVETTATPTALTTPTEALTPTPTDTAVPLPTVPTDTPTPLPTPVVPTDTPTPPPTAVLDPPTETPGSETPTTG